MVTTGRGVFDEVVRLPYWFLPELQLKPQLDKRPESRPSLRGEYIYIFQVAFKVVEQLGATERFWPNAGRPEARCQVVLQTVGGSVCGSVPALEPDVVSLS